MVPRQTNFSSPAMRPASMAWRPIAAFSYKNRPRLSRLAPVPPTPAASTSYGIVPAVPRADFLLQDGLALSRRCEAGRFHIRIHHDGDQLAKSDSGLPIELCAGLSCVGDEDVHFEGPEISLGHLHVFVPV